MTNELMEFEKLESALVRAGREFDYPATPAIAARVREELMPGSAPASRSWLRLLVPIAVAIVFALALLLALPTTRDAVAQFLGLRGLRIFYLTPTPEPTRVPGAAPTAAVPLAIGVTPGATRSATPRPTPTAPAFTQCCETTLEDAQERASFTLMLPAGRKPSKVYNHRIFK
jgi:hypothetical protein